MRCADPPIRRHASSCRPENFAGCRRCPGDRLATLPGLEPDDGCRRHARERLRHRIWSACRLEFARVSGQFSVPELTAGCSAVTPHMARAWVNAFRRAERIEMAKLLRELGKVRFYAVQPRGGPRAQAYWLRDARWRVYAARRDAAAAATACRGPAVDAATVARFARLPAWARDLQTADGEIVPLDRAGGAHERGNLLRLLALACALVAGVAAWHLDPAAVWMAAAAAAFGVSVSLTGLQWIVWRGADARAACLVGILTSTPESRTNAAASPAARQRMAEAAEPSIGPPPGPLTRREQFHEPRQSCPRPDRTQ